MTTGPLPPPELTTCPFTGRVGMWTALREQRPQPRPQRLLLDPDLPRCPFCTFDDPDERLLPFHATHLGVSWSAMHNIYPPIDDGTGRADLAYAHDHDPTLTHLHDDLVGQWAAMLDVQQQLVGRRTDRWSMVSAATGRSAGASQHHAHGHVLTPAVVPPLTIEQQQRWADPRVPRVLLAEATTVAVQGEVRLVAAPVPLGPFDLWLVPERAERFLAADPVALGQLVARWIAGVHGQLDVDVEVDLRTAPFDAKVVIHPELPDGTGRWWGELMVTDRHAPGVAAVPLVDLRSPPAAHAERFRVATA